MGPTLTFTAQMASLYILFYGSEKFLGTFGIVVTMITKNVAEESGRQVWVHA